MTTLLKTFDYFTAEDVIAAGSAAWEKVREVAKGLGFNVSKDYGEYRVIVESGKFSPGKYVVGLDLDGDFVCAHVDSNKFTAGRLRTMSEFIAPKEFPHVKIRVNSNKEILLLAVDELKRRGYDDTEFKKFNYEYHQHFVGVIGGKNGIILVSVSEESFSRAHKNADELEYDLKQVLKMDNIRVKPKLVNVAGVMCDAAALQAFLDAQLKANPQ